MFFTVSFLLQINYFVYHYPNFKLIVGSCAIEVNSQLTIVSGATAVPISSLFSGITGPVNAVWSDQFKSTYVQTVSQYEFHIYRNEKNFQIQFLQ